MNNKRTLFKKTSKILVIKVHSFTSSFKNKLSNVKKMLLVNFI